jgi:hypothetical protein
MRWLIAIILSLSALSAQAQPRYQAVVIQEGTAPRVFILDTREGHLWTWTENLRGADQELRYQGRVRPGRAMGEVIDSTGTLSGQRDR